jgi:regulator of sigma E protease
MTILIFLGVLFVLILVHEWGHFIVAKKTGMRVDEFAIGFPPKLFGVKKGETEYTLNLIPIGGFVKILGENAEDAAQDGRAGADISKSFTSKSKWAQSAVLIAGVTMNVLLAWVLFVIVFWYGLPAIIEEGKQSTKAQLVVTDVLSHSPAHKAGITVGSEIVSYGDGSQALTPSAFKAYTASGATNINLTLKNKQGTKNIVIAPEKGIIESTPKVFAIGIGPSLVDVVSKPLGTAIIDATKSTYNSLIGITVGIVSLIVDIFQNDADLSHVAGPIGIIFQVGDAAKFGLASLLLFTAMISLNLAVINMLPFPALDGGRLLFVAIEAVIGRPINPVWVGRINLVGFVLLLTLMVVVTYSDIGKLL